MTQQSNSNVWFGLAIIILLGFFFFKWLPDWLWRPATPEISINSYIFEPKVTWLAENATIEYYTAPDVYIRINPESAADSRAHLSVTVNNSPVDDNCSHSARYFCHKIDRTTVRTGDIYEITAKNDAGEAHATLKISIKDSKSTSNSSSSSSGSSSSSASSNGSSSNSAGSSANSSTEAPATNSSSTSATPKSNQNNTSNSTPSCYHYESGRCWDDQEMDAYYYGTYDRQYGRYGASFDYDDDCDAVCQDILEDAYDEGWYDEY